MSGLRCTHCSGQVSPVVALDIDGTLGRYHEHFLSFMQMYFGPNVIRHGAYDYDGSMEFSDCIGVEKKVYQEAKLAFRAGGYKRWMPTFSGVQMLHRVVREAGAELWVTTTRPWMRMDNIDSDTMEWLRRNGITYDGLLFDEDKYYELTKRVDAGRIVMVLDDQDDMYDRAVDLGLPVHLNKTKWNRAIQRPEEISSLLEAAAVARSAIDQWRKQHE